MRITIRSRILFIFVGVFCIQALISCAFLLYQHNKDTHEKIKQELQNNSADIGILISSFFNGVQHDLETASQQIERIAQKEYQRHNLLYTLQANNPAFKALVFYDLNGIVKSSVFRHNDRKYCLCFTDNSELFTIPYNTGKPYILPIVDTDGNRCITINQPVFFLDKSYIFGVISALIPYSNLQNILDQTIIPKQHTVLILDNNDRLIACKTASKEASKSFLEEDQKYHKIRIDKQKTISSRVSLDFFGQTITVISTVTNDNSINFFTKSFNEFLLLAFILLLISFLIGWTTYQKIIVPLQKLATSSSTIAQGDDVDNFLLTSDSEFYDLGNALQSMNQQLRNSNTSLKQEVQKRREEEKSAILAKLDAEKTSQAKSIFLANMSHEIRTPLQTMLGMLRMLEKEPLSSEQARNLSMTFVAGERLLTILNSILDLSQIESGKFQLLHSSFSLSKLLKEVVDLMHLQANTKGIEIRSIISDKLPDRLLGDSGRIRQIIINIVTNAIKFSHKGQIIIQVEKKHPSTGEELMLLFSISDSGEGISQKDQQKIFSAFERGKMESDIVIEGSGLGLAISSEFVEHMGGKLWLEKTDSSGSTFCFTILSTIDSSAPSPHTVPASDAIQITSASLTNIHVMLAEDEFINQRIIAAYLEELGADVTVCQDGRELLQKMEHETPDIILMDIRMPVMNGLEATEKIRTLESEKDSQPIPIVALTAQATTDFEEKCRMAGMDDYLTKPIQFEKLIGIILDLVKKEWNQKD